MISTKIIEDKGAWEDFVLGQNASFLQSWAWGQFQKSLERDIYRVGVFDGDSLIGVSLLAVETSKTGSFLYCPAGPLFSNWTKESFESWLKFVKQIAKDKGYIFLKADTRLVTEEEKSLFKKFGFIDAATHTQPDCSATLDLTLSEEQLMSGMSSSTRYNVGMSERRGVTVRMGEPKEIDKFLTLLQKTAHKRDLFLPKEKNYHQKQYEALHQEGLMEVFLASLDGMVLAAALVVFYADRAYYLHAANSYEHTNLRASYNLVWHAVAEAKRRKLSTFDFWGVAPTDDPKHAWSGITSFKLSFGAKRIFYNLPQDLPFKMTYRLSRTLETWRKPLKKLLKFR